MTQRTKLERAMEIRAIVDAEISKPLPRVSEVKRALGLLGPLIQDIADNVDALNAWALSVEKALWPKLEDM